MTSTSKKRWISTNRRDYIYLYERNQNKEEFRLKRERDGIFFCTFNSKIYVSNFVFVLGCEDRNVFKTFIKTKAHIYSLLLIRWDSSQSVCISAERQQQTCWIPYHFCWILSFSFWLHQQQQQHRRGWLKHIIFIP